MTVYSLDEVKERGLFPGFVGKFIHSENMTFVYWDVAEGSPLPAHSHPHEQVINMFEGQFEIRITGGET
ncbi:MAG: cupin domain-containing protein, partial [Caldilineaceae bacterium SB0668_bin_21]|nr:cupin domain-containing protein [Caldilineaceae bacterium SB0668_bin_21]